MTLRPTPIVIALALLAGCEGNLVGTTDGGNVERDAAARDGGALDAAALDAAALDAPIVDHDAWSAPDAYVPVDGGPSSARQTARVIGTMGAPNGYYEYLPPSYDGTATAPLMIFWHGVGEDGNGDSELSRVLANGPPRLIAEDRWPSDRPFIVLSPQNAANCPSADTVRDFLRFAFAHYAVDRTRVYLTGLSCGAIGIWSYLDAYLDDHEITAAALIAGNGRSAWAHHGCNLGEIGLWAFHGTSDGTITCDDQMFELTGFPSDDRPDFDAAQSERTYSEWLTAGSPMTGGLIACPTRRDAQLTLYPGVGHDSWSQTYDGSAGHDIYAWMLSMTRP